MFDDLRKRLEHEMSLRVYYSITPTEAGYYREPWKGWEEVIALGEFIGVSDPKSGWTAVTGALKKILDKNYGSFTEIEKQYYPFLEQIHGQLPRCRLPGGIRSATLRGGCCL